MKIIIVDDEMHALQLFLADLIGYDAEYRFFNDDRNGILKYVAENRPEAAFLDINMPGINGVDLAGELVATQPSIKLVFTTGLDISRQDLPAAVAANTLGFLYKPYNRDELRRYLSEIAHKAVKMTVKTFGTFDCFLDGRLVKFSSSKLKELFALLIAYHGKALTMTDAISQLWPDTDTDKSKILYRDAVWRLRKTFAELHFECVTFKRACLILDLANIVCDYWDYIDGQNNDYNGEFMKSFDWSTPYLMYLDRISKFHGGM